MISLLRDPLQYCEIDEIRNYNAGVVGGSNGSAADWANCKEKACLIELIACHLQEASSLQARSRAVAVQGEDRGVRGRTHGSSIGERDMLAARFAVQVWIPDPVPPRLHVPQFEWFNISSKCISLAATIDPGAHSQVALSNLLDCSCGSF